MAMKALCQTRLTWFQNLKLAYLIGTRVSSSASSQRFKCMTIDVLPNC